MTSPRVLLSAWNLRARKQLGQNFLEDPAVAGRIVDGAQIEPGRTVLEIGPGLGALTVPAARAAGTVHAVEKDRTLARLLRAELLALNLDNVHLREADILKVPFSDFTTDAPERIIVLGNLPYNISSQVLVRLVENRSRIERAVLMFQKELADRLCAPPGGRQYGRLSVMIQYSARIRKLLDVRAAQFFPKPKVDSEVLRIDFFETPPVPARDETFFFRTVKAAFGQRRKTLKNALSGSFLRLAPAAVAEALASAGIDPARRAETLTVTEFVCLAGHLQPACQEASFSAGPSDRAS